MQQCPDGCETAAGWMTLQKKKEKKKNPNKNKLYFLAEVDLQMSAF